MDFQFNNKFEWFFINFRCESLSLQLLEELEPKHNHFSLDISFLHDHAIHFDDEVFRLHLAKAMSKPCYSIACYTTLQKKKVSSISNKRIKDIRSKIIWRSDSLKNLTSIISPEHFNTDPLDDNFEAESIMSVMIPSSDASHLPGSQRTWRQSLQSIERNTPRWPKTPNVLQQICSQCARTLLK